MSAKKLFFYAGVQTLFSVGSFYGTHDSFSGWMGLAAAFFFLVWGFLARAKEKSRKAEPPS